MNELLKIIIPSHYDGLMIKEILYDQYEFSRKSLAKIKNNEGVYLNGTPVFVTVRVKKDDLLQIFIQEESSADILPQPIPIEIIYEDEDIAVINKPPNIVVHPTRSHYLGTIANGLVYYWNQQGKSYRFRPVNRLDKDTSGLFIVAKNQYSHHKLALQIHNKTLKRKYHAIVHGVVENNQSVINVPILKDPDHSVKRLIDFNSLSAKQAITHYQVIQRYQEYTLLELHLETGRTHQIRVHMSYLKHPLVGDDLYGGNNARLLSRQALHAIQLEFLHPITNKELLFYSPYPNDISNFLASL